MRSLGKHEWALLAFIFLYSLIPTFGGLFRLAELAGGPAIVPENPRALADPLPIVLHVVGSFLFCIFGALQFLPSLRREHPGLHRGLGRVVALAGLTSALTGLWMTLTFAFPEGLQGPLLYWARIALSLCMAGLIGWAVVAIRSRNVLAHRAAMFRAYAIGQGASTQAMFGIAWMVALGTEPLGPMRDAMMVLAWGFNLAVAEFLIARMHVPRSQPA